MRKIPHLISNVGIRKSSSTVATTISIVSISVTTIGSIVGSLLYFDNKFETKFNKIDTDINNLKTSIDKVLLEVKK